MQLRTQNSVLSTRSPAFSLIELMVVIAILAILVALVVVGLQRMQNAAARTQSVNALRQMITGYISYYGDNNGRLMPGYVDFDAAKTPEPMFGLNAKLPDGTWMVNPPNQQKFMGRHLNLNSYVWRLSPYLGHHWQTVMTDYRDSGVVTYLTGQFDQAKYGPAELPAASIASAPSYGLNSIFFGGDDLHGGTDVAKYSPWGPNSDQKIAATRASEVRSTRAIVFAPTGKAIEAWTPDNIYFTPEGFTRPQGYPELRPPFLSQDSNGVWQQRQWRLGEGGRIEPADDAELVEGAGLPIARRSPGMIPVACFDGSAESTDLGEIVVDMRRWSPFQTGMQPPPFTP